MFITVDYFKGALQIPNLDKDTTAFEQNYIVPYEKEILTRLLGADLYDQLIANYDTGVSDKWKDLVEGADFTVTIEGVTYTLHWNGLKNSEEISLISYYVYYNYIKQNYHQLTGLGVGAQNMENATVIDPNEKLVWAWNKCREFSGLYDYTTTGENLTYESLEQTLFNFIINNIDDYTNWVYRPVLSMNLLGI